MDPVNPLAAVAILLFALASTWAAALFVKVTPRRGRFDAIDGLKGYLALFVFLHHSAIWYFYLRTGEWKPPPSSLYTHFGQSSVALFFMITGLLFFSKILGSDKKPIDWTRLYVGRFLRLAPLYGAAVLVLFVTVAAISEWSLNESSVAVTKSAAQWLVFTIFGGPDINRISATPTILAGVTWSLPYEWFFYFALPVIACLAKQRVPMKYVVLSLVSLAYLATWGPAKIHLLAFLAGMVSATLARNRYFRAICTTRLTSAFTLVLLYAMVALFSTVHRLPAMLLLALAFALIAGGCSLFGLLLAPPSRLLGEFAYSIYLMHGIVLFVVFRFCVGFDAATALTPFAHWALIFLLCPLLVLICSMTFSVIERPAMNQTAMVTLKIRSLWQRAG